MPGGPVVSYLSYRQSSGMLRFPLKGSFKGDIDIGIGIDIDVDRDSDMPSYDLESIFGI